MAEHVESSDDFCNRIFQQLVGGCAVVGISTGCRLGLFDVLSAFDEPKTSEEIAAKAQYRERYVREWLNLMVSSEVLEVNPEGDKYFLPPHRRAVLSGSTPQSAITFNCCYLPMFGFVEDQIVAAFKLDGPRGTTYDNYPNFHTIINDTRVADFSPEKFTPLYEAYPELKAQLESGTSVCEIGCGQGMVTMYLAETFPKSTITAVDLGEDTIATLLERADKRGIHNIEAVVRDVCDLPADWTNKFNYVFICDTIHDIPNATKCVENLYKVLTPGGHISVMESTCFSNPHLNVGKDGSPFVYASSLYHCLPISHNTPGSEAWGAAWGKEACKSMLEGAGFKDYNLIGEDDFEYHVVLRK